MSRPRSKMSDAEATRRANRVLAQANRKLHPRTADNDAEALQHLNQSGRADKLNQELLKALELE